MKKICALLLILIIAGCAVHPPTRYPDGGLDNESKWQLINRKYQEVCAKVLIHEFVPTDGQKELRAKYLKCLMDTKIFI